MSKKKKEKDIKDEKTIIQQQTQNQKISVIIPVYNEDTDTVSKVVSDILNGAGDELLEILVVDDGSEKFDFSYSDTRVKLLKKEHGGKGSAIKFGVEKAKGDILVFTDGDGELLVEWKDIEKAVKLMGEKNVQAIFGVRRFKGSGSPLWHRFSNRAFSVFVSFITLRWCPDVLCGFRVMGKKYLENIDIASQGYGIESEMFLKCSEITNIPIDYKRRGKEHKKGFKQTVAIELVFGNRFILLSWILFLILFVLYFIIFSPLYFDYLLLDDSWIHLARAKWGVDGIFGKIKLIYYQRDEIINYSWGYQYFLYILLKIFGVENYKTAYGISTFLISIFHNLTIYFCLTRFYNFAPFSVVLAMGGMLWGLLGLAPFPRTFSQVALFLSLFLLKDIDRKKIYILSVIVITWVQIHIFSPVIFLLLILHLIFSLHKKRPYYFFALIVIFISTILNPYGLRIYHVFLELFLKTWEGIIPSPEFVTIPELFKRAIAGNADIFSLQFLIKWILLGIISLTNSSKSPLWFLSLLLLFTPFRGIRFLFLIFYPYLFIIRRFSKLFSSAFLLLGMFSLISLFTAPVRNEIPRHKYFEKLNPGFSKCSGIIVNFVGALNGWIEFFWHPKIMPTIDNYSIWIDKKYFSIPFHKKYTGLPITCVLANNLDISNLPYASNKWEIYTTSNFYLFVKR